MAVLRGKGLGLEIAVGRDFEQTLAELQRKLGERPGFYAGASASASLGPAQPSEEQMKRLQTLLGEHGISLAGLSGGTHAQDLAQHLDLRYQPWTGEVQEFPRRGASRPTPPELSESARSLLADFAGARADIAQRRKHGQTTVRRPAGAQAAAAPLTVAATVPGTATLYHNGTLRGGQSLHHLGNIVVVGDVNPGAELVASGDIVVFGALRGVAHAGAQGDARARVHAIELAPTQLRIATFIAVEAKAGTTERSRPEIACVENDRIAIFAREKAPK